VSLLKSALRTDIVRRGLCALVALYIWVVHAAGRWRVAGGAIPEALWRQRKPFILTFWHGRLLMMPYCWPRSAHIELLISDHPDGRLLSGAIGHFGLGVIVGSTRRGGARAMRAALKALKRGECVGLTPDGPRGPRMRAAAGVIDIARLSGAPIVPVAFAASRRRVLGTWDRFVVALPFSRGVYVWGEPIAVSRDLDAAGREAARRVLEERLNAVTREADRLVGRHPIEPAPAAAADGHAGAP
jgi:hypothetical protein